MSKFKLLIRITIIILCLIGLGVAIYQIFIWRDDSKQIDNQVEEINRLVGPVEISSTDNSELINPPEDKENPYWDFVKVSMIDVDLAK